LRALFLLLLLANLLFVAWIRWVAPPATSIGRATPVAADPQAIRLLREAPLARELASGEAATAAASDASLVCVSAGPYVERPLAEQAAERLARLGFAARIRAAREEIRVGQWVRLENLATPEDAANALGVLKSAGIADAYVIAEEGAGTIISLGVFADEARADQVITIARKSGFEPQVVERLRPADVFWLDIDRRANAGLPALEDLQGSGPDGSPPLELRPCPQSEPATPSGVPTP
jgi:hypothetical protein